MSSCGHTKLILLADAKNRLRCLHCHLTISADELGKKYCPECFETDGTKRYDFEEIESPEKGTARYRCELCGVIIGGDEK